MIRTQEDQEMPVAVPYRKPGLPQPPQYSLPFDKWTPPPTGDFSINHLESLHHANSGSMKNSP